MVAKNSDVARCRDAASAAVLVDPGKCAMSKRHIRVRCFNRKSRVLPISSRVRSPKIFVSGLWSVTTTKLSQPCVKYLVCSSPQATAGLLLQLERNVVQPTRESESFRKLLAIHWNSNPEGWTGMHSVFEAGSIRCPDLTSPALGKYVASDRKFLRRDVWRQ